MTDHGDGNVVFSSEDLLKMMIHGFTTVFFAMDGVGVVPADVIGRGLDAVAVDDPALRWFRNQLSAVLKDPPPFEVIDRGRD